MCGSASGSWRLFLVAAFLQWITYEYPDVNPFAFGAIFPPGMLSQLFNWTLSAFSERSVLC